MFPSGVRWPLLAATFFCLVALHPGWTNAQAPGFWWATRGGGSDEDVGNGIAVDPAGATFVAGYYRSTNASFAGGSLTNAGAADAWLARYDFHGNLLWARRAGGEAEDIASASAVDSSTNCYVTGWFLSTNAAFGSFTLTNCGSADMFLAKYDSSGSVMWVRDAGGIGFDAATSVAADPSGNLYVTGLFYSTNAIFGSISLTNAGQQDVFVAKYDSAGNVLWARRAGGTSFDSAFAVATDGAGSVFIAGNFFSPIASFGPGMSLTNSGEDDVFLAKYDANGGVLWARQVNGAGNDYAYGLAVEPGGNVYLAGNFFSQVLTFGKGIALTNNGFNDAFVAKYSPSGEPLWARKAGGTSDDYGYAVALDSATNIYLAGNYYSTNANFSGVLLTNAGSHEAYVARYDSTGALLWARRAGGGGADSASGLAIDVAGNCHLTGYFGSNSVFSGVTLASAGNKDAFVAHLNSDAPVLGEFRAADQVVLHWPANQLGFGLETTPVLSSNALWTAVGGTQVIVGERKFTTNSIDGNAWYRLRKQ
jgi:hypothetical protein